MIKKQEPPRFFSGWLLFFCNGWIIVGRGQGIGHARPEQGVCLWSLALAGRPQNRAKPARIVHARRSLRASRFRQKKPSESEFAGLKNFQDSTPGEPNSGNFKILRILVQTKEAETVVVPVRCIVLWSAPAPTTTSHNPGQRAVFLDRPKRKKGKRVKGQRATSVPGKAETAVDITVREAWFLLRIAARQSRRQRPQPPPRSTRRPQSPLVDCPPGAAVCWRFLISLVPAILHPLPHIPTHIV